VAAVTRWEEGRVFSSDMVAAGQSCSSDRVTVGQGCSNGRVAVGQGDCSIQ
jgi:hypothetical protein